MKRYRITPHAHDVSLSYFLTTQNLLGKKENQICIGKYRIPPHHHAVPAIHILTTRNKPISVRFPWPSAGKQPSVNLSVCLSLFHNQN